MISPASVSKDELVHGIFNKIAPRYDFLNAVASFGRHYNWQKKLIEAVAPRRGSRVLDVCCGTGMITLDLAQRLGAAGRVVGVDFSESMLAVAAANLRKSGLRDRVGLVCADAQKLPFADNTFDAVTIGYGLRNVGDMRQTLLEIKRVLKPGSRIGSLELAKPYVPGFKQLYNLYMAVGVPLLGKFIAHNKDAYRYLHDSIVAYPHQHEVTQIYRELGFENPRCYELTLGIASVHVAAKPIVISAEHPERS